MHTAWPSLSPEPLSLFPRMTFSPTLAHGADPRALFGLLAFVAVVVMGMNLLSSKKTDEKRDGCIVLVFAGVTLLIWFIYSYWQANHRPPQRGQTHGRERPAMSATFHPRQVSSSSQMSFSAASCALHGRRSTRSR